MIPGFSSPTDGCSILREFRRSLAMLARVYNDVQVQRQVLGGRAPRHRTSRVHGVRESLHLAKSQDDRSQHCHRKAVDRSDRSGRKAKLYKYCI